MSEQKKPDIWIEQMPADGSWPDALSGGARIGIDPAATEQWRREQARPEKSGENGGRRDR